MKVKIIGKFSYQAYPITKDMIEVSEEDLKQLGKTKCFENGQVVNYDNSVELNLELKQKRIAEIKLWFEEYDNQVKQYERCVRLGIEFDKDIVELDNQAKAHQEELRKLNQEVNNG